MRKVVMALKVTSFERKKESATKKKKSIRAL